MGIKLVRYKGKYCVYRFSEEHNHVLVKKDYVHLLPSQHNVTTLDNVFLDLTASSRVSPKAAFDLMGKQASGRESFGFTKLDQKNYLRTLDNEEKITNIFWAYAKMIMDYGMFGDVVSFDTTYKINEANRPFAVFVGLNHHRQMVIFGAALMYDETATSFI
ncbi:protein FAR1-RELATED SEQUENCE 5-like [Argentina anserina]|uniref:protein FAR1-RELATED SEQUENCE 5-like n=1 Tax=Argentina anserina TaxID=57926 RepID=UPI00217684A7|nr:protein FAR1-RELATED SEQUENCE 5-like [Potentilla anserina]